MVARLLAIVALALVLIAAPASAAAQAAASTQVPEGNSVTLFALGLAGVLLGRRLAMRRNRKD